MNAETQVNAKSPWKNSYIYSTAVILVVGLYVGYVVFSRHESLHQAERHAAAQQAERQHEDDRQAIEQLGGSELAIRGLYVSPGVVHPGETAQLCYDVANAKTVTLDPPVAEVWPSHSRCIDLKVKKTTTYTLSIADANGKTVSQSVELKVR